MSGSDNRPVAAGLNSRMANEQLIDLPSTAVSQFKQLWLSANASSFEARQRMLREGDELESGQKPKAL